MPYWADAEKDASGVGLARRTPEENQKGRQNRKQPTLRWKEGVSKGNRGALASSSVSTIFTRPWSRPAVLTDPDLFATH